MMKTRGKVKEMEKILKAPRNPPRPGLALGEIVELPKCECGCSLLRPVGSDHGGSQRKMHSSLKYMC